MKRLLVAVVLAVGIGAPTAQAAPKQCTVYFVNHCYANWGPIPQPRS